MLLSWQRNCMRITLPSVSIVEITDYTNMETIGGNTLAATVVEVALSAKTCTNTRPPKFISPSSPTPH
jgi:hypothetical protein